MRDEDWQTFLWRLNQAVKSAESRGSQDTEALDGDFGAWRRVAEHLRAAQDEMVHRPEAAWDRGLGMVPLEPLPAADGRSGWSPPETRWSLTRNGGLSSVEMLVSAKHSSVRVGGGVVIHKPELSETLPEAMCWATTIAVAECRKYVRDREHDIRRRVQLVRAGYASIADEVARALPPATAERLNPLSRLVGGGQAEPAEPEPAEPGPLFGGPAVPEPAEPYEHYILVPDAICTDPFGDRIAFTSATRAYTPECTSACLCVTRRRMQRHNAEDEPT